MPSPSAEWWDRDSLIEQPFIIDVFLSTKSRLNFVRNLTEVARTRFSDEEFGGSFYRSVSKDIEEADLLLDSFVQFLSINTPLKKRGTVHRLIEEVLRKYQVQLNEKGVRLSKKYERDLPETIVPDGPLSYILDSILQYGISSVSPGGDMECSTKSSRLKKDVSVRQQVFTKDERYIEIEFLFKSSEKQAEPDAETPLFQESLSLMLLGLAKEVARKNQGIMKLEKDEKQGRVSISLWFPSERREIVYYRPIDLLVN